MELNNSHSIKTKNVDSMKLNNPDYYRIHGKDSMNIIIDIVEMNASYVSEVIYLFNVLKYLIRYPRKNGKEDLLKARDYLDRLILNYDKEVDDDTKRVFESGHSARPED